MTTAQATDNSSAAVSSGTQTASDNSSQPSAETQNMAGVIVAALIGLAAAVLAIGYPIWTPYIYSTVASAPTSTDVTAAQVNRRLTGEINALQKKIDELTRGQVEMQKAIMMAQLPGILMVAGDLNEALQTSTPFKRDLDLFRAVTGESSQSKPIVDALAPFAEKGAPTNEELATQFDELVYAIISADQKITSIPQLPDQMFNTMANISAITMRLRWRLEGLPVGESVPAIMARAEALVADRDYANAVTELEKLPEPYSVSAADWISGVKARNAVDAVQEDLEAYLVSVAVRLPF